MKFMQPFIMSVVMISLIFAPIAKASRANDWWSHRRDAKICRANQSCVPCAGAALVIEEIEPNSRTVTRVRLEEFSARRENNNTIVVERDGQEILRLAVPKEAVESGDFVALSSALKTLNDICTMKSRDYKVFDKLVDSIVLPKLIDLGLSHDALLMDATFSESDDGAGFVLIIVLFILLVIIGAGFGPGGG